MEVNIALDRNRMAAFSALFDIETKGAYSNIAVNRIIEKEAGLNEAFIRNLVYGVLENQIYLDYRLGQLIKTKIARVKPQALILLRMGACQLEFMDSVPPYAAINESVAIGKKQCRGLEGFINGVLRSYERKLRSGDFVTPDRDSDPVKYLSVAYSYNSDIVKMWIDEYGLKRAESLMKAGNGIPPLTIRVNRLKTDVRGLVSALEAEGFSVRPAAAGNGSYGRALSELALEVSGSGLMSSQAFKKGLFSVQDASSMLAVLKLAPAAGDVVIDVCAAPGGKTLCAAEIMRNEGRIISCDIYGHKLKLIENYAERLGVNIVETLENDGRITKKEFFSLADKVIADVPCSGLGVVRRKPEIKLKTTLEDVKRISEIQLEILENAAEYVKEKGSLLYSTCTISKCENQGVIDMFLKKNKKFFLASETQLFPDYDNADGFYFSVLQRF